MHNIEVSNSNTDISRDFYSAEQFQKKIKRTPILKSGIQHLDDLLQGGFRYGLVHLIIGDRKECSRILMRMAVRAFFPPTEGGIGASKIVYIDGENKFSPYFLSKLALSLKLDSRKVLNSIHVARAFNWSQMVELTEKKLSKIEDVDVILIAGLTSMFEQGRAHYDQVKKPPGAGSNGTMRNNKITDDKIFNDLKSAISGIKRTMAKNNPIIVITAPRHENSLHKPVGGKILTHFGCVVVEINKYERRKEYVLAQHPFLPFSKKIKWKSLTEQIMGDYMYQTMHQTVHQTESNSKNMGENIKRPVKKMTPFYNNINGPYMAKINRMRLRAKRGRSSNKRLSDRHENLTLDYFLKFKTDKTRKK